ncbi:hypothetical protein HHK36_025044 [Tetracentron sinense]|uniref:High-affinity nitrate transporter n=1 Tax=Tetracentron sinense TaxID=13715 RepID=A0A834YR47_TETSI|nr:hypothetical protein HHK36_025044 [Tetracentron sinense]
MASRILVASILVFSLLETCYGGVQFSTLKRTLLINASPKPGELLKAGDMVTVTWGLNQSLPAGIDDEYKNLKVKLCYAPISQKDRAWRKTVNNLSKDKTCQFTIVTRPYKASKENQSFKWAIERDVPTATYFVRAYAYNSAGEEVAFGQTTDSKKTTYLFDIQAITGRHPSLDIASVCFSAFSVVSLFGFFFMEKRKAKISQKN